MIQITDYRTPYSGIRPKHMANASREPTLITKVKQAIKGRIIVGYDLKHDWKALGLEDNRSAKWVDLVDFYEDSCKKKKGLKEIIQNERFIIFELEIQDSVRYESHTDLKTQRHSQKNISAKRSDKIQKRVTLRLKMLV